MVGKHFFGCIIYNCVFYNKKSLFLDKQEHTLFNDLRRKLAKRSKELVYFNIFLCSLQKGTIKFDLDLEWYLSQYQ